MQSDPYLVFDHWKCAQFYNLLMEPHWDPNNSGNEQFRALKMDIPKEKFVKNQNVKSY